MICLASVCKVPYGTAAAEDVNRGLQIGRPLAAERSLF